VLKPCGERLEAPDVLRIEARSKHPAGFAKFVASVVLHRIGVGSPRTPAIDQPGCGGASEAAAYELPRARARKRRRISSGIRHVRVSRAAM
jgi:hypothetical protein